MMSTSTLALLLLLPWAPPLSETDAFVDSVRLLRAGDPVAAEVALGPLLDRLGERAPGEQAAVLTWAAVCADAGGRPGMAKLRLKQALQTGARVELPPDASLRLAKSLDEVRAELIAAKSAPPPSAPPSSGPPPSEAAKQVRELEGVGEPSAPPSAATASDSGPQAAAAENAKGGGQAAASGATAAKTEAADGTQTDAAKQAPSAKKAEPAVEEEDSAGITLGGSLWAFAGAALTFGVLAAIFGAVFGGSALLHWFDANNEEEMNMERREDGAALWPQEARFAGIGLGIGVALLAVAGASAGGALWLEE